MRADQHFCRNLQISCMNVGICAYYGPMETTKEINQMNYTITTEEVAEERINNWSDRKADANGKVPPVGNTVNVKKATYTNKIGEAQLSAVWTDPDFDPKVKSAYYVRVLEIPTPRWSTYDAVQLGVAPPDDVPASIQERAWSSPIWYNPSK